MLFMIFRNRTRRPCVIVMAHYPGRADASTPFSKGVGAIRAIELARCLILDTIAAVSRARAPVFVAYHPPERKTEIAAWLGKRLRLIPQDGGDPGERKYTVLLRAFALGFTDALLVEGDVPDLPAGIVIECLDALGSGDAVVGPATGGGYYCIGFRREGPVFDALTDIPWGTDAVLAYTLERINKSGCAVRIAPSWSAVDSVGALASMVRRNPGEKLHTVRYASKRLRHVMPAGD